MKKEEFVGFCGVFFVCLLGVFLNLNATDLNITCLATTVKLWKPVPAKIHPNSHTKWS